MRRESARRLETVAAPLSRIPACAGSFLTQNLTQEVLPSRRRPLADDRPWGSALGISTGKHDPFVGRMPTQTTFLFTDIEGSTSCCTSSAPRLRGGARRAPAALREAFARHGGVEVDTQGDAFFFAFPDAREAVDGRGARGQDALAAGPDPRPHGPAHRARRTGPTRATSARTSTSAPASPRPATADRSCSRKTTRDLLDGEALARPRRAPPEGLRRAGPDLPARRRSVPAAEDDLEHEPAPPRELRRP